jgi:hypothetical protein
MRRTLFHIAVVAALLAPPARADAAQLRFGTSEQISFIQDVTAKGPEDEPLFLGRLIRTQNFIGGYSFEDAGFVLGVKGDSKKFYNMPTGEELARLQRAGFLPSPLPDYQPGFLDYLVGYSLWLVVLLIVGGFALDHWRKRRKLAAETLQAPH